MPNQNEQPKKLRVGQARFGKPLTIPATTSINGKEMEWVGTMRAKMPVKPKGAKGRGSDNARAVAQEVIQTIRKGEKVVMGKIIKKHGYSNSISKAPTKVTETQSYKQEISPFVASAMKERDEIMLLLPKKRKTAQYHQLVEAMDKLTKNIQLLTGGDTERDTSMIEYIDKLNKMMGAIKQKK